MQRQVDLLRDSRFDLLIMGGGITGAGVALDAALRGVRVALIDKGDFASGTSSVSSKLVHGGLRYLEHGDFKLVYEALHERSRLLRNAPHLVHPLRFVIPFLRGSRVPAWKWRVGLTMYDLLAGSANIRRSHGLDIQQTLHRVPGLSDRDLLGGAQYYDAQMDDARVCLEVLRSAVKRGAVVANYVEAVAFERHVGMITGIRVVDRIDGGEFILRAHQVLNAAGPWVDHVARLAGDDSGPRLRPTKGVHVVLPGRDLTSAVLVLHPRDGRVFFVIPWYGKTLIGTTDTLDDNMPETLHATSEDVAYLLDGFNHFFHGSATPNDVMGSFAGLRPLIRTRKDQPSSISREFSIFESPSGLISVAGGKYTTYRSMAQAVTDRICRRIKRRPQCRTEDFPLDGTPAGPWRKFAEREITLLHLACQIDVDTASHLVHRYGRRAEDVVAYIKRDRRLAERVVESEPDILAEFVFHREHEMAVVPEDYLLRRTRLGLFHPHLLKRKAEVVERAFDPA